MPHQLAQQRMTLSDLEWPSPSCPISAVAELLVHQYVGLKAVVNCFTIRNYLVNKHKSLDCVYVTCFDLLGRAA